MLEIGRRLTRRDLLKAGGVTLLGLGATAVVGCGEGKKELAPPPEGFSRNSEDYRYKIIVDVGKGRAFYFYTNSEPILAADGGQNLIEAENVYCPSGDIPVLGCDREFIKSWKIASPKRILVQSQEEIK